MTTVKAVTHTDIKGKEQLYLVITTDQNDKQVIVSVGQKTYEAVLNIENQEPTTNQTT